MQQRIFYNREIAIQGHLRSRIWKSLRRQRGIVYHIS